MKIVPLEKTHLSQVNKLLHKTFDDYNKYHTFEQSTEYFHVRKNRSLFWKCWVLLNGSKVIGITGLYETKKNGEVWVGWYCIDKAYRGKGYGRNLLRWTIAQAKRRGYHTLKLWTSDAKAEAAAQFLYESLGLKKYRSVKNRTHRNIYRAKVL
ncbi:MAG: hypothetical protein A2754_03940 [Candidatus Magasanikbacteria bacterium RIFCSPHIGHO2_01_FULL_47_8]|uniref:N-acetyltransferase domain-containing protein n=1 Tax=Candidatus Magasanikbacteria bacterium RIFCSPHIGHO2_01_FULL_47_8 TaxID=1798673 RepID=A0A1F6ME43_9BACT|nr:MAG: hypothetical protein A2754_03940 [Candidatus Magasanikbacteria bacterium RIFCSPHIGHO2_01_FULL_47_8]